MRIAWSQHLGAGIFMLLLAIPGMAVLLADLSKLEFGSIVGGAIFAGLPACVAGFLFMKRPSVSLHTSGNAVRSAMGKMASTGDAQKFVGAIRQAMQER